VVSRLCKPLLGTISDRTRTRYGRRRVHIVLSSMLLVVALLVRWGSQLARNHS
jgi:Na+/melibiose symporter-like transporter